MRGKFCAQSTTRKQMKTEPKNIRVAIAALTPLRGFNALPPVSPMIKKAATATTGAIMQSQIMRSRLLVDSHKAATHRPRPQPALSPDPLHRRRAVVQPEPTCRLFDLGLRVDRRRLL